MNGPQFLLLLNAKLKQEFLNLNPNERRRLKEKFTYLENGMWDSGVKVKKLKGPSGKVVFEARLNKGDRLLFTLGREHGCTCIYLWGKVHHDDIGREAVRVVPDNAPFLNFEALEMETLEDFIIDELDDTLFTQESLEDKVKEEYGPQKWLEIDERELERLFSTHHPDTYEMFLHLTATQHDILTLPPPLLISGTAGSGKTTLSVYYLLRGMTKGKQVLFVTCSRHLKEFSQRLFEGLSIDSKLEKSTGEVKFTLLSDYIDRILETAGIPYNKKLLVGFNEFLQIISNHPLSKSHDAELVWEEIRSIIKGAVPPNSIHHIEALVGSYRAGTIKENQLHLLKESLLSYSRFEIAAKWERIILHAIKQDSLIEFVQSIPLPHDDFGQIHCKTLVELVRLLKSREHHFSSPLLSLAEYSDLGRKRAPNFLYDRAEIHRMASYYQEKIEAEGRYDAIDLCRRAIEVLDTHGDGFLHDLVVCDEVQDLSDLEVTLLFRLSRIPGNIVCAGDPKQIINPSGFRWEELRKRFYERSLPIPDVRYLNLNFRCVGSIVELSNSLLLLKQRLVGISGYEQMEDWKFHGRPPLLFHGVAEQEMLRQIGRAEAGRTILVRTAQEKKRLVKLLGTELIFTIHEAKGLEFDTVLLWKFAIDKRTVGIWRKMADEQMLQSEHHPIIRHEINMLYVATTRARNTLVIYDGISPAPVWNLPELTGHVFSSREKQALQQMWKRVSTPAEWMEQGEYFFTRQRYIAAKECFRNADDHMKERLCEAFIALAHNRHVEAAKLFASISRHREAAEAYELADDLGKAIEQWIQVGDEDATGRCQALQWEKNGQYLKAAQYWRSKQQYGRMVELWRKGRAYRELAIHFQHRKEYAQAAHFFGLDNDPANEASCLLKLKEFGKAAKKFLEAKDYAHALPLFRKLKDELHIQMCLRELKDYHGLGMFFEKKREYESAYDAFLNYGEQSPEHRDLLKKELEQLLAKPRQRLKVAVRMAALGHVGEAATIFMEKGMHLFAATLFRQIGDKRNTAECYALMGWYDRAIDTLDEVGDAESYTRAVAICEDAIWNDYAMSGIILQQSIDRAKDDYRDGNYSLALTRFLACADADHVYKCGLKTEGRDEEVLDFLVGAKQFELALKLVKAKPSLMVGYKFLQRLVEVDSVRSLFNFRIEYPNHEEQFLLALLYAMFRKKAFDGIHGLVTTYLSQYWFIYNLVFLPDELIEMAIEVRHYNFLKLLFTFTHFDKDEALAGKVKMKIEQISDDAIISLIIAGMDERTMDPILETLPVTEANFLLFGESGKHYQQAIDFLLERKDYERAIHIYYRHGKTFEVAKLQESIGDFKQAAKTYRDHEYFDEALNLYRRMDDRANIARTYERMRDFDKAIALWKELGKTREVARIEKKMAKLGIGQPELFQ